MTGSQAGEGANWRILERLPDLRLPEVLRGVQILVLGLGSAALAHQIARQGAQHVVGIEPSSDRHAPARLESPRNNLDLLRQPLENLPTEQFDLIVVTMALHQLPDPKAYAQLLASKLKPGGRLIVDAAIAPSGGLDYLPVWTPAERIMLPTLEELTNGILQGFAVRVLTSPARFGEEPFNRVVAHAMMRLPILMLVHGPSFSGKTSLVQALQGPAVRSVSMDLLLTTIALARSELTPLEEFIAARYDAGNLGIIYEGIDEVGLTAEFLRLCGAQARPSDRCVLLDGAFTERQMRMAPEVLAQQCYLWGTSRLT